MNAVSTYEQSCLNTLHFLLSEFYCCVWALDSWQQWPLTIPGFTPGLLLEM